MPTGQRGAALSTIPSKKLDACRARGRSAAAGLNPTELATLHAGAASVQRVLPAGTPVGGYLDIAAPRSAEPGEVYLGALLLAQAERQIALLSLDAATVTPHLYARVRQVLPASLEVVVTASHCHTGPGGIAAGAAEQLFFGPHDEALCASLVQGWQDCVARARVDLAPVQVAAAGPQLDALLTNRTEAGAPLDATLDLLSLRRPAGEVVARLVGFAAHPTLAGDRTRLDGDYPAALRRVLRHTEQREVPLLFGAGPTGAAAANAPDATRPVESMGEAMARRLLQAESTARFSSDAVLAVQRAWLPLPPARLPAAAYGPLREELDALVLPAQLPVDLLRVGVVLVALLPGELSAECSSGFREHARQRGITLQLLSHNGAYGGYFLPRARHGRPGPESYLEIYGPGGAELIGALLEGAVEGLTDGA